ncbi:MAG: hypothetical protein U1A78_27400 [Polyangia bacterium]
MDVQAAVAAALRGRALLWSTGTADAVLRPDGSLQLRPHAEAPALRSPDGAWVFLPDADGAEGALVEPASGRRWPLPRLHLGARRALGFVGHALLCCESTLRIRTYPLHAPDAAPRCSPAYTPCADGEHVDFWRGSLKLVALIDAQEAVVTLQLPSLRSESRAHWGADLRVRRLHSEGEAAWLVLEDAAGLSEVWSLGADGARRLVGGLPLAVEAVHAVAAGALWLSGRRPDRLQVCDARALPTDLLRLELPSGRLDFVSESLPRQPGARLVDVRHAGGYFALLYREAAELLLFVLDPEGRCLRSHRRAQPDVPDMVLSPEGTVALMLDPPPRYGGPSLELLPVAGDAVHLALAEAGCELRFADELPPRRG